LVGDIVPDLVLHELTDLPDDLPASATGANSRMCTEGTGNLLAAARAAGVRRLHAQGIAWVPWSARR
jgi:hypothetical protein